MRKTQYEVVCLICKRWVDDVLFEFVDDPGRLGIREVSIHCATCNTKVLRGV